MTDRIQKAGARKEMEGACVCMHKRGKMLIQWWNEYRRWEKLFFAFVCLFTCPTFPRVPLIMSNTLWIQLPNVIYSFLKLPWTFDGIMNVVIWNLCCIWWFLFLCIIVTLSSLFFFFLLLCSISYLNVCSSLRCHLILSSNLLIFTCCSNFTSFWLATTWIIGFFT